MPETGACRGCHPEALHGDKTLEYRTAEIFHMRDGKAVERWAFSDDTAAIVAFFAWP